MNRRNLLKRSIAAFAALSTTVPVLSLVAAQDESQKHRKALKLLEADLQGTLLLPADPRYRAAAISANARFNQVLPLAIAKCKSPKDVATCHMGSEGGNPAGAKGRRTPLRRRFIHYGSVDQHTGHGSHSPGSRSQEVGRRVRGPERSHSQ